MDTETNIMNIFHSELPDPNILLYLQRIPGQFDHFTLFPKLPIEISFAIWHLTFVTRRIRVKGVVRKDKAQSEYLVYESRCPSPISLQVNKESRTYALKHYQILVQGPGRTHYYYAKIDTVSLSMMTPSIVLRLAREGRSPELLKAMTQIEHLEWHYAWWVLFLFPVIGEPSEPEFVPKTFQEVIGEGYFRKLKSMHVIPNKKWLRKGALEVEQEREECTAWLRSGFEAASETDPEIRIPEVSLGL